MSSRFSTDGRLGLDGHADEGLPVFGGDVLVGEPPARRPRRGQPPIAGAIVVAKASGSHRVSDFFGGFYAREEHVSRAEVQRFPDERRVGIGKPDE